MILVSWRGQEGSQNSLGLSVKKLRRADFAITSREGDIHATALVVVCYLELSAFYNNFHVAQLFPHNYFIS